MATLRGTDGRDTLRGGSADDRILGLAAADLLSGRGGDDEIEGGEGRDQITGGRGNDRLVGGGGADQVSGGPGNDQMQGQLGADVLAGGRGRDQLDGGDGADQLAGGSGNDWLFGGLGVDVLTGGAGADQFVYRSAHEGRDRITDFDPEQGDGLRLTGALTGAAVRTVDDGTDTTVQVRTADADGFTDLVVLENHLQPIDVWYGDHQQFGDPGEAQSWVNILGNVATTGLASLTFALNDGPEQALNIGPNTTRLQEPGDFNIELDYDQLDPTRVDDVVTIRAAFDNGEVFTREVTVDYEGGQRWPTTYSVDWANVTNLQDVVQVVDGLWAFDADGARPAERGYDRVLAIGDAAWDSYELQLSVTPHDLQSSGGNFFIGMQWNGHTLDPSFPESPLPPHTGWIPSAGLLFTGSQIELHPTEWFDDRDQDGEIDLNPVIRLNFALQEDHTYNILIENQRVAADTDASDGIDRTFRIKVWEEGDPEPDNFLIEQTMVDQTPRGSIYLNAHLHDVTYGDISVTPLPAGDAVQNQDALAELLGAGAGDARPVSSPSVADSDGSSTQPVATISSLSNLVVGGDDGV